MKRLKTSLLFLGMVLLTSCGKFSEITVGEIRNVSFKGFEENVLIVAMTVPVENPTAHKITITDFDSKAYMNNQYLGKVTLRKPVIIKPKTSEAYDVTLNVQLANFFGMALNLMNMKKGQKVLFRLEGEISARSLLIKKKILIDESREVVI